MPQKKQPQKLHQMMILYFAKQIENLISFEVMMLPKSIIQEIINCLPKTKSYDLSCIEMDLWFRYKLSRLICTEKCSSLNTKIINRLISEGGDHLKEVSLFTYSEGGDHLKKVSPFKIPTSDNRILSVFKTFTNVTSLKIMIMESLRMDVANDMLEIIGKSCHHLEEFYSDINCFTVPCIMKFLKSLPFLKIVSVSFLVAAIRNLYALKPEFTLNLRKINFSIAENDIEFVVKMCPLLEELSVKTLSELVQLSIKQLKYLTVLTLNCGLFVSSMRSSLFSFQALKRMELYGVENVDLNLINEFYPLLTYFICTCSTLIYDSSSNNRKILPNIKHLQLWTLQCSITENSIVDLFSNWTELEYLYVSNLNSLNDRTMKDILKRNPLNMLREFKFNLRGLSMEGLNNLLFSENNLNVVGVHNCRISFDEIFVYEKIAKENNLNIELQRKVSH